MRRQKIAKSSGERMGLALIIFFDFVAACTMVATFFNLP